MSPAAVRELLEHVARQVQQVRQEVVRRSAAALEAGDWLAEERVQESRELAERLRATGLDSLEGRLADAQDALASTQAALQVERRVHRAVEGEVAS